MICVGARAWGRRSLGRAGSIPPCTAVGSWASASIPCAKVWCWRHVHCRSSLALLWEHSRCRSQSSAAPTHGQGQTRVQKTSGQPAMDLAAAPGMRPTCALLSHANSGMKWGRCPIRGTEPGQCAGEGHLVCRLTAPSVTPNSGGMLRDALAQPRATVRSCCGSAFEPLGIGRRRHSPGAH
jgi:hypothetical protein